MTKFTTAVCAWHSGTRTPCIVNNLGCYPEVVRLVSDVRRSALLDLLFRQCGLGKDV